MCDEAFDETGAPWTVETLAAQARNKPVVNASKARCKIFFLSRRIELWGERREIQESPVGRLTVQRRFRRGAVI